MIGDKILNYAPEINSNIDEATFKQLVSGEPIEARLPFGKPFIMDNYAKLMFNTNELPKTVEHNKAFYRRLLIIPFEVEIPANEQDPELAKKIIENELPGVLNWIIEGLQRLLKQNRFSHSSIIDKEISDYKQDTNNVVLFIIDNNIVPDNTKNTRLLELYTRYKEYCIENGFKAYSSGSFRKSLESEGFVTYRASPGVIVCCGV